MNRGPTVAHAGTAVAALLSASLLALFVLPIVALIGATTPSAFVQAVSDPAVRLSIGFTLYASAVALGLSLLLGVPLGYLLARRRFRGRSVVEAMVGLPVVVPHLVAGLALLWLFSPSTPVGRLFQWAGVPVFGTFLGVVLVMAYVSASYTVLASQLAFAAVDVRLPEAARTLGATPAESFRTVTMPLAVRGILAGALLTWARSVSEIGGFLILAYSVYPSLGYGGPVTSPVSILVYNLYQIGNVPATAAVAALFLLVAFAIFLGVRWFERSGRMPWNGETLAR